MPLFYLHLRRDGVLIEDPDGADLPDLEAARAEAVAGARDLWAEAILEGEDLCHQSFVIANDRGEHVLEVPFTDALPQGLRQRLRAR